MLLVQKISYVGTSLCIQYIVFDAKVRNKKHTADLVIYMKTAISLLI